MKTSRKEFIKELHADCGPELQQRIEAEFPKLFPQEKFKVGDWVVLVDERPVGWCSGGEMDVFLGPVQRICHERGDQSIEFDSLGIEGWWFIRDDISRKATDEEIKEHLIKEAEERGFVPGAKFKPIAGTVPHTGGLVDGLGYVADYDMLLDGRGAVIYVKGQWAEIIPEIP